MAKRKKHKASVNMDPYSFSWEDAFYIHNLNDGTLFYRQGKYLEEEPFYNLCFKPNPFYPADRHLCIASGSYENMLLCIKNHVSCYETPRDMHEAVSRISNEWNRRLGAVMMGYAEEWWDEFGYESTSQYEDDIMEYIELGKQSKIYSGLNVKVKYTESEEVFSIEGRWGEWLGDLVDAFMEFDGYTKVELYNQVSDYIDVSCLNDVFAKLRERGIKGIKQMKRMNMYRWFDVLAPLVNDVWYMSDGDEE